jgi:hypothetical protein
MGEAMKKNFFSQLADIDPKIFIGLIAITGVLFGALLNGLFGDQLFTGKNPKIPTPGNPPVLAPTQILLPALVPSATFAMPDSTMVTDPISLQATEQAHHAIATSQANIAAQQTQTVQVEESKGMLPQMLDQLATFTVLLSDSFDDDTNGWTPNSNAGYAVSMENGALQMNFSEPGFAPFLWTCDRCGSFDRYSYQVDIKSDSAGNAVVAGLVFGSPSRIDEYPFQEAYALLIFNSGEMTLQRISSTGIQTVQQWDKYHSQFTPDGNYHTLQVLADQQTALIVIDGKALGDAIELSKPTNGYVGLVVQSTNATVYYDNLKVLALP